MKKLYSIIFVFFCCVIELQATPTIIPKSPAIAANSYILIDYHSGKVIAESNSTKQVEPASITKLMTAYIVFHELKKQKLSLQEKVYVSEKAWKTGGSKMFIRVDTRVSVEDLLKGMIVQSGNDASIALAEHVAGSEDIFVTLMNQFAKELGMKDTHFQNSTGLPHPQHYTTARDLANLAAALIREFPEYYQWYSMKSFRYNKITQRNRNTLLGRLEGVDGMKTGHTESAGYCLVSSAKREQMRLISVVLGANSKSARANESSKLLSFGFRYYETVRLYQVGEKLKQVKLFKAQKEQLSLGLTQPLYVTIPRGEYKLLKVLTDVKPTILAPIEQGEQLGVINVMWNGNKITRRPLVALESIAEGSLWQRTRDHIKLMFH